MKKVGIKTAQKKKKVRAVTNKNTDGNGTND